MSGNGGTKKRVTGRCLRVWRRNALVYRKTWKISFLPPLLEPLLYIAAFGLGLGGLLGRISWRGGTVSYLEFLAPALVGVGVMNGAFFENTYNSFVRMYYQKTFDAMLATPLTLEEIVTGEILWGGTKAVLSAAAMMLALTPFGLVIYPAGLLLLPLALLGGLAFGALGMLFTGILPNIETFNLPVFLLVTPMFLFSGTFFPLEQLPGWAQRIALALPLTHLSLLSRALARNALDPGLLWSVLYLAGFGLLLYPFAVRAMCRRLIT